MLFTKSIRYPNTIDIVTGKTELDSDTTSINHCLGLILTTAKGELLGDPNFGSRLHEMLFEQYSENFKQLVIDEIVESITAFETRVSVNSSNVEITPIQNAERTKFHISITYEISKTSKNGSFDITLEEESIDYV